MSSENPDFIKDYSEMTGIKTVGIIGLGLIGGSYAKAFRKNSDVRIYAYNRTRSTLDFAILEGTVDEGLTDENIGECDLIISCLYPDANIDFLTSRAHLIKKGALVTDAAGLKERICSSLWPVAKKNGFVFAGGHPMAGKKDSGYKYSASNLYKRASLIVCPEDMEDIRLLDHIKKAFLPCGFGRLTVCTPEEHDRMIAFTSEMPHIISNAFIKSPTAADHKGFNAGSYHDMTRVAWLNEEMWTEIFMENRANIINELDILTESLTQYREALSTGNEAELRRLLKEGKDAKASIDKI